LTDRGQYSPNNNYRRSSLCSMERDFIQLLFCLVNFSNYFDDSNVYIYIYVIILCKAYYKNNSIDEYVEKNYIAIISSRKNMKSPVRTYLQ
jgi:hypothetical protein